MSEDSVASIGQNAKALINKAKATAVGHLLGACPPGNAASSHIG
jgi:hypothetical protein